MANTLKWAAVPGALHYIVTIDGVKKFQVPATPSPLVNLTAQPTYRALAPGAHNLTISAVDKNGIVGKASPPAPFTVGTPAPATTPPAPATQLAAPSAVALS
jgi:hypothetical protein